ncbi:MAG: (deoxy)nucleoside triphosphate pyrophosphohydrolase [Verrucomicrobiota bacterium]
MTPIPVAAGLLFAEGRLLVTQRPPGSHLAGCWEFPGGKLEPGESWESALARELHEELGARVEVGPLVEEITHAYPGKTVQIRFYRCRWVGGTLESRGCAGLAWVDRPGLADLVFPAADARLIRRLQEEPDLWPAG